MELKLERFRQPTFLIIGRLALGAMLGIAIKLTYLSGFNEFITRGEIQESIAFPLIFAPLLMLITLALAPGRKAIAISAMGFFLGCLLAHPDDSELSPFPVAAFLFSITLAQAGWHQIQRSVDASTQFKYDGLLVGLGAFVSLISLHPLLLGSLAAAVSYGAAHLVDAKSTYQGTTVEKAFNQMAAAIRILIKDRWSLRLMAFALFLGIGCLLLFHQSLQPEWDVDPVSKTIYLSLLFLILLIVSIPALAKLTHSFALGALYSSISLIAFVLLFANQWITSVFVSMTLLLIAVLVFLTTWRRFICEMTVPLPPPMRYLSEPFLLVIIGISGSVLYSPVVEAFSFAGTLFESSISNRFELPPSAVIFLGISILALTIGIPNRTQTDHTEEDLAIPLDIWYLPGQNPMVELPRRDDSCVVTIAYCILEENHRAFEKLLPEVGKIRRRAGAIGWQATQDPEDGRIWREHFTVDSWEEYADAIKRESERDRAIKQEIFNLNDWDSLPMEEHLPIRAT